MTFLLAPENNIRGPASNGIQRRHHMRRDLERQNPRIDNMQLLGPVHSANHHQHAASRSTKK
jgi:hypothetical protein